MREIPGYSGYYVDNTGSVYSDHRGNIRKLKGSINLDGYLTVTIINNKGVGAKTLVHRLIALTYYGHPATDGLVVRHLNGSKLDNIPSNLAWGTVFDNYMDAVKHGTRAHGEMIGGRITPSSIVVQIRKALSSGESGKNIAIMFGVSTAQVSRIKNLKRWAQVV